MPEQRTRSKKPSPTDIAAEATLLSQQIRKFRRVRQLQYWQVVNLAGDLNDLRGQLNDLVARDPRSGAKLLAEFVHLANILFVNVDDSGGYLVDIFEGAIVDWGAAWSRVKDRTPKDLANLVLEEYRKYDHNRPAIIRAFADALGAEGLDCLEALLRGDRQEDRRVISDGYAEIADARKDVDGYIAAHVFARDAVHYSLEIAERMLAAKRPAEALEWLDRGSASLDRKRRAEVRAAALEGLGRAKESQAERWALFEATLNREAFNAYLDRLPESRRKAGRTKALAVAKKHDELTVALEFLVSIDELGVAESVILKRRDEIDGSDYEPLRPVAKRMEGTRPLGAIVIYRALALEILRKTNGRAYRYAVRDLRKANALAEHVRKWQGVATATKFMSELRAAHRLKHSFWPLLEAASARSR